MPYNEEQIRVLADHMHTTYCTWNHTDGCSWLYERTKWNGSLDPIDSSFKKEDWSGYAHREWYARAKEILEFIKGL